MEGQRPRVAGASMTQLWKPGQEAKRSIKFVGEFVGRGLKLVVVSEVLYPSVVSPDQMVGRGSNQFATQVTAIEDRWNRPCSTHVWK